jgi:hypothetical protein
MNNKIIPVTYLTIVYKQQSTWLHYALKYIFPNIHGFILVKTDFKHEQRRYK